MLLVRSQLFNSFAEKLEMSDRIVRNPTFVIRNYLGHNPLPLEKKRNNR
jgi:hypothetical protein